jgi:hypothetical protein
MALDKPYDITEIPYFPYEPGFLEWSLLLVAVLSFLAFYILKGRGLKSRREKNKALSNYLTGVEKIWNGSDSTKEKLTQISILLRRALSYKIPTKPILSMTSKELTALEVDSESATELIHFINRADDLRFKSEQLGGDFFSDYNLSIVKEKLQELLTPTNDVK